MNPAFLRQALVGVDGNLSLPGDGGVGELLARVAAGGGEPPVVFARAAGVLSACRLAAVALEAAAATPEPALADSNALPSTHGWNAPLATVFAEGPLRLQHEACLRLAAIGAVLPAALLPAALDAGKRSVALRDPLVAAAGHRGRWLAQFHPDWDYAAGVVDPSADSETAQWEQGQLAQRVAWLRALRAHDHAAARERLAAQWKELPAKERLELLAVLEQGLQAEDEAFLDPVLKDRSRDVRVAAARLLARIPQSAHARRLTGWLEPLVVLKRGLLRKSWRIEAPAQADPAWTASAIEPTRPQHGPLGERAWWLCELVRQVSLDWWTSHTGMTPSELIAWAATTDWKDALLTGWRARVEPGDRTWIEAMLADSAKAFRGDRAELLAMLPVPEREKHWPRTLEALAKQGELHALAAACAPGEWLSAEYSRELMAGIHAFFASERMRNDYYLRGAVLELACIVHPSSLPSTPIERRPDETPGLGECIHAFERIAAIRRTFASPP